MRPAGLIAAILLLSIGTSPVGAADRAKVIAAIADTHIIPRYRALQASAEALSANASTVCHDQPDALKSAYHALMDDWMRVQHIRFGPIQAGARRSRLQYWPDRKGRGRRQLWDMLQQADPSRLEPAAFAGTSVAVQGLPALEILLFTPPLAGNDPEYRCQLVAAIGRNLAALATSLVDEWTAGPHPFRFSMTAPGPDNPRFRSPDEVVAALLTDAHSSLLAAIDQKLLRPLNAGNPKPKRAESWRSRRSLRNIWHNVESLQALFEGEANKSNGLSALLRDWENGAIVAAQFRAVTNAVLTQIAAIDRPLYSAVSDPGTVPILLRLGAALKVMDAMIVEDIAPMLDVPLGFNALDGD